MKKLLACIAISLLTLTGCQTTSTSTTDAAYTAGCVAAGVWTATGDYQPTEVRQACIIAYNALNLVYGDSANTTAIDSAAAKAIDQLLGDDATDGQKTLATMFFNIAKNKLDGLITDEASKLVVLKSFTKGLNDTLGITTTTAE